MSPELPFISDAADGLACNLRQFVGGVILTIDELPDEAVDFRRFETGECYIVSLLRKERSELIELNSKGLPVISRFFGKFVVSKYERPPLGSA